MPRTQPSPEPSLQQSPNEDAGVLHATASDPPCDEERVDQGHHGDLEFLGQFHFDINGMVNEQVDGAVRRAQFAKRRHVPLCRLFAAAKGR